MTLERVSQNLPIPLGGLAPAHGSVSGALRFWRRRQPLILTAIALASSLGGAWLSTSAKTMSMSVDARGVHLGDILLTPVTPAPPGTTRLFAGAAALALVDAGPGRARGAAVMTWNGQRATGRCLLASAGMVEETCTYRIGALVLRSVDTYDPTARIWHRVYDDGLTAQISVPPGSVLIPIPFPLGR